MSKANETRNIELHETFKCKCRLDESVCNNKQRWNKDKRRCECKKLIYNGICDERFIWNPSDCDCECDKSCDVGEYIDYKNCKCREELLGKSVEECTENIDGNEMTYNAILSEKLCNSCTLYYWSYF